MKYFFLIVMVLGQFFGFSQSSSERKLDGWDMLNLRTNQERSRYDIILRRELCFTDTSKDKNKITITYFSSDKKTLRSVTNHFDTSGCLRRVMTKYFNNAGLIEYQEDYRKCCNQELTDDEMCFEYASEYARFQYDQNGRLTVHVYHLSTPMTIKATYTYSSDGTKQVKRERLNETKFWD